MNTLAAGTTGQDLAELSAGALIGLAERGVVRRRETEVDDLRVVLAWADVHSTDPRHDPETGRRVWAEDRLVHPGGEGAPGLREFSVPELALAREVSVPACERDLADALDLRHGLPRVWGLTQELACPLWLSRKVARLSRRVPVDRVWIVDAAVAEAIGGEAPGRVLAICEAKVIEADEAARAERVREQRRRRYVGLSRTDEFGLRQVIARVDAGDAVWIDAIVDRVADLITDRHPDACRDELRAIALGWLARPAEVMQLLLEAQGESDEVSRATALPADLLEALATVKPERFRPQVDLHVHLSDLSLAGLSAPVARGEGVGPLLADSQLFAGCRARVTPVIDLNDRVAVDCYEHPTGLARRVRLGFPATTSPTPPPSPAWPALQTSTTPRRTTPTGRPARPALTTPGRWADDITGGRRTRVTPADSAAATATSGALPTAATTWSITRAPTASTTSTAPCSSTPRPGWSSTSPTWPTAQADRGP